eukprot:4236722-Amphidinium_carterae.1
MEPKSHEQLRLPSKKAQEKQAIQVPPEPPGRLVCLPWHYLCAVRRRNVSNNNLLKGEVASHPLNLDAAYGGADPGFQP